MMQSYKKSKPKLYNKDNLYINEVNVEAEYIIPGPITQTDWATSAKTKIKIQNEFSDIFTGTGCFKGTFSLKVKNNAKP